MAYHWCLHDGCITSVQTFESQLAVAQHTLHKHQPITDGQNHSATNNMTADELRALCDKGVPRRRFGRTELSMPIITCGGMRFKQLSDLAAVVAEAMRQGINHFETASMYMGGNSEIDFGHVLSLYPRDSFIIQTKIRPIADRKLFRKKVQHSMSRLQVRRLDLLTFHGINQEWQLEHVTTGGCMEEARQMQAEGLIGHIGFSTHAQTPLVLAAIQTDLFDYVNLHFHWCGSYVSTGSSPVGSPDSGNGVAVRLAAQRDMGVLIISPFDKGGKMYEPSDQLVAACAPLLPLQYAAMWLWRQEQIHTISVGAQTPTDFATHIASTQLAQTADGVAALSQADGRLEGLLDAHGFDRQWRHSWWHHLPSCYEIPGGVNVRLIVWLYTLYVSFGMLWFVRARYADLENQKLVKGAPPSWDWTQGTVGSEGPADLEALLEQCGNPYPARIAQIVREAHTAFGKAGINHTRGLVEGTSIARTQIGNVRPETKYLRTTKASLQLLHSDGDAAKMEKHVMFAERLGMMLRDSGDAVDASMLPQLYQERFGELLPLRPGYKLKDLLVEAANAGVCVLEERQRDGGRGYITMFLSPIVE